jgi:hypothetical protein
MKPIKFDKAVFMMSLDFELLWGSFDSGKHRKFISHFERNGANPFQVTRAIVDDLLALFQKYDIAVTWATVGHLMLDHCEMQSGVKHPDMPRAKHSWFPKDWYTHDPCADARTEPLWYGRDMVEKILSAQPKHDLGSHSFSHVIFSDAGCTREVAEAEVRKCVEVARTLNIKMQSFVFPRNEIGYLDVLPKHGFTVTRERPEFWFFQFRNRAVRRMGHMVDDFLAVTPACGRPKTSDAAEIWVVPVSMFLQSMDGARRLIPARSRVRKAVKGIERAIDEQSVFHLSFHPTENVCFRTEQMFRVLDKILAHAARRRDEGKLQTMTMAEMAGFCEQQKNGNRAAKAAAANHG